MFVPHEKLLDFLASEVNDEIKGYPVPLVEEFRIYAHFGRTDLFKEHYFGSAKLGYAHSLAQRIEALKKMPVLLEEAREKDIAYASGVDDELSLRKPPEEQKKLGQIFDRKSHTPEQRTQDFFTKPTFGQDYSVTNKLWRKYSEVTPPVHHAFSHFLMIYQINQRMNLIGANLTGQIFSGDHLFFEGADFSGANLRKTTWNPLNTSIRGANFSGANLQGAQGMTPAYLATAIIDEKTKLPESISRVGIKKARQTFEGGGSSGSGGPSAPSP